MKESAMPQYPKSKKVTEVGIKNLIKNGEIGRYALGDNLYLSITPTRAAAYVHRFTLHERTRELGLGSTKVTTLAEAREMVIEHRKLIRDGIDPKAEKDKRRAERAEAASTVVTFKQQAEEYIAANEDSWKSDVHTHQWKQTMQDYVFPLIGDVPVGEITREDVHSVLSQQTTNPRTGRTGMLWVVKHPTATNVRSRIDLVMGSAKAKNRFMGDNPAAYKDNLEPLLPKPRGAKYKAKNHPALPYDELPEFMAALRSLDSMSARALEFCILTATRTSETLNARHSEIDYDEATWTIPAERMKAGKEHSIPLSPQALACLPEPSKLSQGDTPLHDNIFYGQREWTLSNMAMSMCLRGLLGDNRHATVHGFRSTFRDWANDQTAFPEKACESALAHSIGDATVTAYHRSTSFDIRRALMEHWADYCDGKVALIETRTDKSAFDHFKFPQHLGNIPVVAS